MRTMLAGLLMGVVVMGCAANGAVSSGGAARGAPAAKGASARGAAAPGSRADAEPAGATLAVAAPATPAAEPVKADGGTWIGAAGASDFLLPGTRETQLGVWIDVPAAHKSVRVPAAVALLVDTSGSMDGAKIAHARAAARAFVDGLRDGDIVSLVEFSDSAAERVAPTVLDPMSRASVARAIAALAPGGNTNLFDGIRLAERHTVAAPATHPVRRVVLVSDGQANVGPSSPEVLGTIARRGADYGVQVTSLGVGADYDERTLNALAVASSGRLYHLSEPQEMASILEREVALLRSTAATEAFVEVVPAPGVELLGADGARADRVGGALRVPLGTMFGGQHRELLVRVRVTAPAEGSHPLASVRLHFRDPANGNLARVQEVLARYEVTDDPALVAAHENETTQTIAAVIDASKVTIDAAQQVNAGDFAAAEAKLAEAEQRLLQQAARATSAKEKARAASAASVLASARQTAQAAAAAPPGARRMDALKMNSAAMHQLGH